MRNITEKKIGLELTKNIRENDSSYLGKLNYSFNIYEKKISAIIEKGIIVDDIFVLLCKIIEQQSNESIGSTALAKIIGFNIEGETCDLAEKNIYNTLINFLEENFLINNQYNVLSITPIGKRLISEGKLFSYSKGEFIYKSFINFDKHRDINLFKEFKLSHKIVNEEKYIFSDFEKGISKNKSYQQVLDGVYNIDFQILNEINAVLMNKERSSKVVDLTKTDITINDDVPSLKIDLYCFKNSNGTIVFFPFYNNIFSKSLQDYIHGEESIYQFEVLRIEYQNLISNDKFEFDINDLIQFHDVIDWSFLLSNNKVKWNQNTIDFLLELNLNISESLSKTIPINIFIDLINTSKYDVLWDWTVLTKRVSFDFLFNNINNEIYLWDEFELSNLPFDQVYKLFNADFSELDWNYELITSNILEVNQGLFFEYINKFPWNLETALDYLDVNQSLILYNSLDREFHKFIPYYLIYNNLSDLNFSLIKGIYKEDQNGWDWLKITTREWELNKEVVITDINFYEWDVDYINSVSDEKLLEEIFSKCSNEVRKRFNYKLLINKLSDNFLVENLANYAEFWDWELILIRLLKYRDVVEVLVNNNTFKDLLSKHCNHKFTTEKLYWSEDLINLLDSLDLIKWQTIPEVGEVQYRQGRFVSFEGYKEIEEYVVLAKKEPGFDINSYVVWTKNLFNKYNHYLTTSESIENLSRRINDINIVLNNKSYRWSIPDLINNSLINLNNLDFVDFIKDNNTHSVNTLLGKLDDDFVDSNFSELIFERKLLINELSLPIIEKYLIDNLDFSWDWDYLSHILSVIFLINNYDHLEERIDYNIIHTRLSKVSNDIERSEFDELFSLINPNLWDKDIVSQYLSSDFIISKIDDYEWNWSRITPILPIEYIKDNLINLENDLDWSYLSSSDDFTIDEKIELIIQGVGYWDWDYLSNNYIPVDDIIANINKYSKSLLKSNSENLKKKITQIIHPKKLDQYLRDKSLIGLWDWNYLSFSDNKKLRFSEVILEKYENYLNWDTITNESINALRVTPKLLFKYNDKWNWDLLSKNKKLNFRLDLLIGVTRGLKWDFDYISRYSSFIRDKDYLEKNLDAFSEYINWSELSHNPYLNIEAELIQSYIDKDWDWNYLSKIEEINTDDKLLKSEKPWNWEYISENSSIFSDETKVELFTNKIHWGKLSKNSYIKLNRNFLEKYKEQDWDFDSLSKRGDFNKVENYKLFNNEIRPFVKSFITNLSEDIKISFISDLANDGVLDEDIFNAILRNQYLCIETKDIKELSCYGYNLSGLLLNDKYQSESYAIELSTAGVDLSNVIGSIKTTLFSTELLSSLQTQKSRRIWSYISGSDLLSIDNNTIHLFKDYLDFNILSKRDDLSKVLEEGVASCELWNWYSLSKNKSINFSMDIILKYEKYWDWNSLSNNSVIQINEEISSFINKKLDNVYGAKFYKNLKKEFPKIYHFAHLENASNIINQGKIMSRNKAEMKVDSAGSVVGRKHDAHSYARFYFRTNTPTQYYNEGLGRTHKKGELDYQAKKLGFPKCPVPIFFIIDIDEVFAKYQDKCFVSNGNMQSNSAKVWNINDGLKVFNFDHVYDTFPFNSNDFNNDLRKYILYSQQEFLILNEIDITIFNSLKIVCRNEIDKESLLNLIDNNSPLITHIEVNPQPFMENNAFVNKYGESFRIDCNNESNPPGKLKFEYSPDRVYFEDYNKNISWLVYQGSN